MRLQANLEMSTDWVIKDYRRIFMALIKNVFSTYDPMLYINLYGTEERKRKINKPFTFSLHFPDYKRIEGNKIYCGNRVGLFFSSNDELLVTAFYNGLKKNKEIIIGENYPIKFRVGNIRLLSFRKINNGKIDFKTISPILVNEGEKNLVFLSPTHPNFNQAFKFIITTQANHFNIPCDERNINIEINSMKKLPLTHYNQTMTSWLGSFTLTAPKEVLQLVYDIGIGVRRSQGFGMLEIEKHY
jgi:CRISPR-associated endoribonuclease Cas6